MEIFERIQIYFRSRSVSSKNETKKKQKNEKKKREKKERKLSDKV